MDTLNIVFIGKLIYDLSPPYEVSLNFTFGNFFDLKFMIKFMIKFRIKYINLNYIY